MFTGCFERASNLMCIVYLTNFSNYIMYSVPFGNIRSSFSAFCPVSVAIICVLHTPTLLMQMEKVDRRKA